MIIICPTACLSIFCYLSQISRLHLVAVEVGDSRVVEFLHVRCDWGVFALIGWQPISRLFAFDRLEQDALDTSLVLQVLAVEWLIAILLDSNRPIV